MPRITALEPAPGRARGVVLYVDGEAVCHVPDELRARRRLSVGEVLTGDGLQDLIRQAGLSEARDVALRYLSFRPRTRVEVLRHLRDRGLGSHAEPIVGRFEELGYIDDAAYALAFARERIRLKPRGMRRVVSELVSRGVDRASAERAAAAALEEEGVSERDLLMAVAERRAGALGRLEPEVARRRLTGYLLRRGFPASDVREAVNRLLPDPARHPPG